MAATMQAFLQPQRKQQPATKSGTGNVTAHLTAESGSGCDRGLGDLRPSASGRGGDAVGRGACDDDATEAEEERPSGRGRDDAGEALARRLGLHSSSSSGESDGGRASLSEEGAWADVLADDGACMPREMCAAGVDPMGLHSPGKRGRVRGEVVVVHRARLEEERAAVDVAAGVSNSGDGRRVVRPTQQRHAIVGGG